MNNRRNFLKKIAALPFLAVFWGGRVKGSPGPAKHFINRFSVAGFQYYRGPELLKTMRPGENLSLLADPENEHDPFAVKILYRGIQIGYVPRSDNHHLSRLLRRNVPLLCKISKIKPKANPWRQLRVKVWLLDKR